MTHYLQHSLATSTRTTYNSATHSFNTFALTYNCLHPNGSPLPASENTLMLFATFLTHKLKPQSIKVYLLAVRNLHLEHGLPDPTADALNLRRLMRGIKRVHGCPTDHRLPITPTLLRTFLNLTHYDHTILWAAILLAFFGFLRSQELLALQHSDLARSTDGYRVQIRCSKTDPFRSGATIRITPSGDPILCAVTALDALVAATGRMEGPLFRLQSGVTLSRPRLTALIRALAARSGVATAHYSSHSFRIGAASAAAAAGLPEWRIQALGRWSTDCYRRYVRLTETESDTIAAALARAPL